jgi:YD repeat-containing protein
MKEPAVRSRDFWRPPFWKWGVFVALTAGAVVLFFRKPAVHPAKVELLPFSTSPPPRDGAYPYLVVSATDTGSVHSQFAPVKFKSAFVLSKPTLRHDSPENEFAVDLHNGRFLLRQTDVFVQDILPLALTRTYRTWEPRSQAFGVGTNHLYDICPTGDHFPYTYMDLNLEDGRQIHLSRISKGTGYADAVFRHSETSSEFYGAQVTWNGNGWTLTLQDHREILFPDSYQAKRCAQGAPIEIRDGEGHSIRLQRNAERDLQQLISPSGHRITFKYDNLDRITEADDVGQIRKYAYSAGHLDTVSDGVRPLYEFEYEILLRATGYDPYLMTEVKDGNGKELLRNWYSKQGMVSEQRLGDGEVYRYDYLFGKNKEVVETIVTLPDGSVKSFFFENGWLTKEK